VSNYIIAKKSSRSFSDKYESKFREGIKVSLMNLGINVSYFDININIKRDEEKKRNILEKKIKHIRRIEDTIEKRNNLEMEYRLNNFMY